MPLGDEFQFDLERVGSVGTLISAALETAGHAVQADMLNYFGSGLASSLGASVFIIAAIGAVGMVALGGNYKFGVWFLIGPFVYYWLLFPTVPSKGVRWELTGVGNERYGVVEAATAGVTEKSINEGGNNVGEVSWFFALYSQLTAKVTETLIGFLNLDVRKANLTFINKTESLQTLLDARIDDAHLKNLIQLIVYERCGEYFTLVLAQNSPNFRFDSAEELNRLVEEIRENKQKSNLAWSISYNNDLILEAIQNGTLVSAHPDTKDRPFKELADTMPEQLELLRKEVAAHQNETLEEDTSGVNISCRSLWWLITSAVRVNAQTFFSKVAEQNTPAGMTPEEYAGRLANRLREDNNRRYLRYFDPDETPNENRKYDASALECNQGLPKIRGEDGTLSDPLDYYEDEKGAFVVECLTDTARVLSLIREMTLRMIFKEMQGGYSAPLLREHRSPRRALDSHFRESDVHFDADIRETQASYDYAFKGDYFTRMLSLPYVQGIGLYFLAVSFPFFALFVIFPGKHHSFLLWLGVWFWLKSWDVGFALIMLMDELLYNLFPAVPPVTDGLLADPDSAFKAMLQSDPSYSMVTYYNIMTVLLAAVPAVSGILVKRGGSEVVHALVQGWHRFSGRTGFAMGQYQMASRNQDKAEHAFKRDQRAMRASYKEAAFAGRNIEFAYDAIMASSFKGMLTSGGGNQEQVVRQFFKEGAKDGFRRFLGDAEGQRAMNQYFSRVERDVAYATYNSSYAKDNMRLAHDTILNYYSNHDFIIGHPYDQDLSVMRADMASSKTRPMYQFMENQFMGAWQAGKSLLSGNRSVIPAQRMKVR